ncbi:MAG: serine hydrolase domain-containing protein [Thermotogota bacterium]
MNLSRAVAERAVAEAYEKLLTPIEVDEPGGVVLVSSRGEQLASAARGVASLDSGESLTLHAAVDAGSVTKIVTGLAVAILEEEGALSPATRLRDVLPEFPAYGDPLRLEHLLCQESGLRNYFGLLYYRAGWHPRLSPSPDEVFEALCRVGSLSFEPGSQYQYCDSNYFLLARIVERITGKRFGVFAQSRILDRLGMRDSYFTDLPSRERKRAEGYVNYAIDFESPYKLREIDSPRTAFQPVCLDYDHVGAEGLCTSAHDLALLAKHTLFPLLVSAETMRERVLRAPRVRSDGFGYGYGLNVGTYRGRRFIGHDGSIWGYSASVAVLPDDELEIVALSNRDNLGAWDLRDAVLDALGIGEDGTAAPKPSARRVAPPTRPWKHLLGRYLDPSTPGSHVELVQREGGPALVISGGRPADLDWVDSTTLQSLDGEWTVVVSPREGEQPSIGVRRAGGAAGRFEPFSTARGREVFREYEGEYSCQELATTFVVEATESGIRLTNRDPRRPSMDLDYAPTVRDYFWSRDPYVDLVELRFIRKNDAIRSFVYRGGREDLRFLRASGDAER